MTKKIAAIIVLCFMVVQAYGLNKIRWKEMDWRVYETEHFDIYHYEGSRFLARLAAGYAEDGYKKASEKLKFGSKNKIPLFIYENGLDFSSTSITLSFLGEGTGGFTEAFKNRVVLPGSGSFKAFREVIEHEIVHAVQFNIIYGEGFRSYNALYKGIFVPTWVMEGLAEHVSQDSDSFGEMVLRDAVINNAVIPLSDMDGFEHLEEMYLGYKQAQSVFEYIALRYGAEKVHNFIHAFSDDAGEYDVFKKSLKVNFADFEKEWMFYLKKKYWAQAQGRDSASRYGPRLTTNSRSRITYDQAPVFSPDGRQIAFVSTREGHRRIYLMNSDGSDVRTVFDNFEGISTDGNPLCWENDSEHIYFASREKGRRAIFKGNVNTRSASKLEMQGHDNVYSPAVSPDGRYLAFVSSVKGLTDIMVLEISTGKIKNITNNVFANNSPSWSPDGTRMAFTEERDDFQRIAVIETATGAKRYAAQGRFECMNPVFGQDGSLYYVSDMDGVLNLYKTGLSGGEKKLTNVMTGLTHPSVSDDYILYSYFEDGCFNIYKYLIRQESDETAAPLAYVPESVLPPADKKAKEEKKPVQINEPAAAQPDDREFLILSEQKALSYIKGERPYVTSITPDILIGLLGFSSDSGFVGAGYASLSDMLGEHNAALMLNIIPGYYAQVELEYIYAALPFDIGLRVFYYNDVYRVYDTQTYEFFSKLNVTQAGGRLFIKNSIDMFSSVSLGIGTMHVTDKYTNIDTASTYEFGPDSENLVNYGAVMFERDYTSWRDYWPYAGDYLMLYAESSELMFGGTRAYSLYEIDARKYFDLAPLTGQNMSFAARLMGAATSGRDRPNFVIGGPGTIRGLEYGGYSGDKVLITGMELRHTVAKNINFKLWPLEAFMIKNIKAYMFNDSGLIMKGELRRFDPAEILNGFGFGIAFDMFMLQRQYVPMKFEFAKRTDIRDDIWKFYFSINTSY